MDLNDIRRELERWYHYPDLLGDANLAERADALDFLHFVATALVEMEKPSPTLASLVAESTQLAATLQAANQTLFQQVHQAITAGPLRGRALRTYLEQFASIRGDGVQTNYGALDVLIDGIFGLKLAPAATIRLADEMVHCEETPALALLDLVDQLDFGAEDRFYDLGCGLGQVVMLVNLLCGVPACGIEIEPTFVDFARRQAAALQLEDVCFLNADVQVANYNDGTIFFLFTPFRGQMLRRVLARLQDIAKQRPIRVCTFGPCTPLVADEPWLYSRSHETPHEHKLAIFDTI